MSIKLVFHNNRPFGFSPLAISLGGSAFREQAKGSKQKDSKSERYYALVISRFYLHNFRCLENFELPISGKPSSLLIGKNGSGKTTVALALEILQQIGRGTNRVGELLKRKDFSYGRTDIPIRLELEVQLDDTQYSYSIAFELPPDFKEARVREEKFAVNGQAVYSRECAHVTLARTGRDKESKFSIDWHLVALPIIQEPSSKDPFDRFKLWLRRMLILRPVPSLIAGDSDRDTLEPNAQGTDFAAWFAGLLAEMPSAYSNIDKYLRQLMPDLKDIKNPQTGTDSRSLTVQFSEMARVSAYPSPTSQTARNAS